MTGNEGDQREGEKWRRAETLEREMPGRKKRFKEDDEGEKRR